MKNIVYESECGKCNTEGSRKSSDKEDLQERRDVASLYVGESARSLHERAGEHWRDAELMKEESHMREHLQEAHRGEENPDFRFKVVKKCKTSLERQVREAVRIQIRGNVLNKKGTYNRCKLTRMVIDEEWDRKVWEEAWEQRGEEDETGDTLMETTKSKRKEPEEGSRKRAKMASEEGLVWGEYREDPGVARSSFMTEGEERQPGVASQSKLVFHSGLECCMREILKEVANLSVEVSSASREATEWEAWDGEGVAKEPAKLNPTVATKQKPSKKELYLWRRLDEVDKEIADEEKRAVEKKRRGVERARHRKGAGVNQPSILSKFNKVASSSLEQAVADEVRIASVTQMSNMKSVAVIQEEKKSDEILSVAQLSSQCSMESKPVCSEMCSI